MVDCVAASKEEFITIATRLALDSNFRTNVVSKLRDNYHKLDSNEQAAREWEGFFKRAVLMIKDNVT